MSNFKKYSEYYDLIYDNKKYELESNYIIKLIKKHSKNAQEILELGCGSGNHAKFFSDNGFNITGIEKSEEMISMANKKNIKNFSLHNNDISNFELNIKFDVAVSLFHVMSYLTENDSLLSCLNCVSSHLNKGGLFIFDFWHTPSVYFNKPETRVKRFNNSSIKVTRIAEPKIDYLNNVVDVNFDINIRDIESEKSQNLIETHPMRHFSIPEIDLLAKLTGFEIILSEELISAKKPSNHTWGVCVVLKKVI